MADVTIVTALIGLAAGLLIGCVGVGGVILVPALVYGLDVPIHDAIASAMMGYIFTGLMGTAIYARSGSIRWSLAGWIALGAGPGALFGAWALNFIDPRILEAGVGVLALLSGLNAFAGRGRSETDAPLARRPGSLMAVGAVTGALSAVTGTGGPLVLVPILIWMKLPTLAAVGLSQAAQIPIATLATAGNFLYGDPDVSGGVVLGLALTLGTWAGAKAAHAMPRQALTKIAAVVLIVVGALVLARLGVKDLA